MSNERVPEWQVRRPARQQILEEIHSKITRMEAAINPIKLHWFLLHELGERLRFPEKVMFPDNTILIIPGWPREHTAMAKTLLLEIAKTIEEFQQSKEESLVLFAELFEWLAEEIARPYQAALEVQEGRDEREAYGLGSQTFMFE